MEEGGGEGGGGERGGGGGGGREGYWGRVLSLGCVVYKQTWRKQSSEECEGVGGRKGGGEERRVRGTLGWGGGTRGQGPLSPLRL